MKDFENKIIRVYLNENNGYVMETGLYVDMTNDFLVIKNTFNNKIQYLSKFIIRHVEIVKSINE